jgi:hypothetical protein
MNNTHVLHIRKENEMKNDPKRININTYIYKQYEIAYNPWQKNWTIYPIKIDGTLDSPELNRFISVQSAIEFIYKKDTLK